jgi:hypothetical protein
LLRETGATPALLDEAVSASLLPSAGHYGDESISVLSALVELGRSGIEPRHLRTVRASVDRELGLIETALAPLARKHDAASRARVAELSRELAAQVDVVRSGLVRSALGRLDA